MKLIFGVCCSGGQCEEMLRRLSEEAEGITKEVADMLLRHRYVDDFMKSVLNKQEAERLAREVNEALAQINMKTKGWTISGEEPREELTQDGVSIKVGGITWYLELDVFRLGISLLFFRKKKRGRISLGTPKFEPECGITVEEFAPEKVTREMVTSIVCRVWDPLGKGVPLVNKFKNDLRKLSLKNLDWGSVISSEDRDLWIDNIKMIEQMRDIMYVRCSIPSDALRTTASIYVMNDAAQPAIVTSVYARYERPQGEWSCQQIFGKGALAPLGKTLPKTELQALSNGADVVEFVVAALGSWVESVHVFTDNEICLAWVSYESVKLNTFERNRVINITSKVPLDTIMHVQGKVNPADVGTRPDTITVKDIIQGSVWLEGYPWMKKPLEQAKAEGIVKSIEDIKLENDQKKVMKEGGNP